MRPALEAGRQTARRRWHPGSYACKCECERMRMGMRMGTRLRTPDEGNTIAKQQRPSKWIALELVSSRPSEVATAASHIGIEVQYQSQSQSQSQNQSPSQSQRHFQQRIHHPPLSPSSPLAARPQSNRSQFVLFCLKKYWFYAFYGVHNTLTIE